MVPDKYIRKAYYNLLSGLVSGSVAVPVYDKLVPKSVDPVPAVRVIINSITKKQADTSRAGHNWNATIELDIIAEFSNGNVNSVIVDDIEDQISTIIDLAGPDISVDNFTVYNTQVTVAADRVMNYPTRSVHSRVVRYNHILG